MRKLALFALILILVVSASGCIQFPMEEPAAEPSPVEVSAPADESEPEPEFEEEYNYAWINKEHNYGMFETKLIDIGYFTHLDSTGSEVTEFRASIEVKNVGTAPLTFYSENAYVQKIPDKYEITGWNFDGLDVEPNETRTGYLLFNDVPKDLSGEVTVCIGTSISYSAVHGMQMHNPHKYELVLE
ncbi:MAG: hypothetical protein ABIG20_04515 [archaeon]